MIKLISYLKIKSCIITIKFESKCIKNYLKIVIFKMIYQTMEYNKKK